MILLISRTIMITSSLHSNTFQIDILTCSKEIKSLNWNQWWSIIKLIPKKVHSKMDQLIFFKSTHWTQTIYISIPSWKSMTFQICKLLIDHLHYVKSISWIHRYSVYVILISNFDISLKNYCTIFMARHVICTNPIAWTKRRTRMTCNELEDGGYQSTWYLIHDVL